MRVFRATALSAGVLAVPAASTAATVPDFSTLPVSRPRAISPDEMQRELARIPKQPARAQPPVRRLGAAANVRVVDDVALIEVEACDTEPGFDTGTAPTCGVFLNGDFQGIPFYDYTWSVTVLGKQLLDTLGDEATTIVLFNQYPTSDFGGAFYMPIFSEVEGIGTSSFDFRESFGNPNAKLRGIVSMNNWWNCDWLGWSQDDCTDEGPWPTTFRSLHGVLGQEVGHEWGANLRYMNDNGARTRAWLGRDNSHWSYWANTGGSPLEGNHWIDNGDGSFKLQHVPYTRFSDLDLYTMGVMAPEEVQPTFYIKPENCTSDECDEATPPETGRRSITGERVDVTIDQVIEAMGERSPGFADAPRFHRELFVFTRIAGQDDATTEFALQKVGRIRRFWNEYFYEATRTRMRAITTLSGRDDYPRFDFTIGDEGWSAFGNGAAPAIRDGQLVITAGASGSVGASNANLQIDTAAYPTATLRVALPATAAGKKVRLTFGSLDGTWDETNAVEIAPLADGVARTYGVDLRNNQGWTGTVGGLRVELVGAAEGETLGLDRVRFLAEPYSDQDEDNLVDIDDNCPATANEDQADSDGNGVGDVCEDRDDDGVSDGSDNCPDLPNATQTDANGNGVGDDCEDTDRDGVLDPKDNCREVANADQADADHDGIGDACDDGGTGTPDDDEPGTKPKKDDGGCTSAAALPSAAGFLLAGLALTRRRR